MRKRQSFRHRLIRRGAVPLLLGIAGCSVGPAYEEPDVTAITAPAWRAKALEADTVRISTEARLVAAWWEEFGDKELMRLITDLARQNLTLDEARRRVAAAQAIRDRTAADRLPRVDGTGAVAAAETGKEGVNFSGPPPGQHVELYSAGLAAAWELDLWGRIARLEHAADADVAVAIEDYHHAAVSLAADIATAYVDLRTLQARLAVLDRTIELQRQTLALVRSRLDAGSGSELEVAQAQRQLSQTLALRPPLRDAFARSENRIAILVGRRPGQVPIPSGEIPAMPRVIGLGLPADLVERRADIRRATAAYRAAVERIGAAEAEKYPTVTVSGTLNVQSTDFSDLFGGHAFTYNIGPNLRVPLFDGGRIDAGVRERTARALERRSALERTILEAIGEVENAAAGVVRSEDRQRELADSAGAAGKAATLAEELYRAGLSDLLQVVDAQRELVDIQDRQLVARHDALIEAIRLYRALGGGWQHMPLPSPDQADNKTPAAASRPATETTP